MSMRDKAHWSFWLIGVLGLLWNVGGSANFLMQMNPEMVAEMPATHRAMIDSRPIWATAGFALTVFGVGVRCLKKTGPRTFLEFLGVANWSDNPQFDRLGVALAHTCLF